MSTTEKHRSPMTYGLDSAAAYGYALAALAEIGPASSADLAVFLATRETPHDGAPGALGAGWYPMSVARLLTQIQKHHYPVTRDEEGRWVLRRQTTADQRAAITECYRLAAIDDRPQMPSRGN